MVVLLIVCALAATVALMLFDDDAPVAVPGGGPDGSTASLPPVDLAVAEGRAFDPLGTGTPGENNSLLPQALDGDPDTAWRTEGYRSPTMDPKAGVGYHVVLAAPATVEAIRVTSPSAGWDAAVYTSTDPGDTLESWGEARTTVSGVAAGSTTIDIDPVEAGHVLIWFTRLAPDQDRFRVRLAEIDVFG